MCDAAPRHACGALYRLRTLASRKSSVSLSVTVMMYPDPSGASGRARRDRRVSIAGVTSNDVSLRAVRVDCGDRGPCKACYPNPNPMQPYRVSALRRVSCRVCVAGPTRISQSFSHALTAVHFRRTLGVRCAAQEQLSALTQFGHGMPPWSIIYTHNFTVPVQHDGARHHSFGR